MVRIPQQKQLRDDREGMFGLAVPRETLHYQGDTWWQGHEVEALITLHLQSGAD